MEPGVAVHVFSPAPQDNDGEVDGTPAQRTADAELGLVMPALVEYLSAQVEEAVFPQEWTHAACGLFLLPGGRPATQSLRHSVRLWANVDGHATSVWEPDQKRRLPPVLVDPIVEVRHRWRKETGANWSALQIRFAPPIPASRKDPGGFADGVIKVTATEAPISLLEWAQIMHTMLISPQGAW